jgi:hypothetical protein
MASLLLVFLYLFSRGYNTASQKKSIIFYHVLNYSIEAGIIYAVLDIYINFFYHI